MRRGTHARGKRQRGINNQSKSVEYRLVMRRGKRQRGINNQFLITRFSIKTPLAGAEKTLTN
jgi:hypothetical protein